MIGAGSAGAIVAAGLAARSTASVLLVEEGPVELPDEVTTLARQQEARSGALVRRLDADRGVGPDATSVLTGRVLGGGWSINHGVMVVPTADDLRRLHARAGAVDAWRPEAVRDRIARRTEDVEGSDRAARTEAALAAGRVPMLRTYRAGDPVPPAAAGLLAAAAHHGLAFHDDIDRAEAAIGTCAYRLSAVDGQRYSSASVLLDGRRRPAGLTVAGGTAVERIELRGGRAVGVRVRDGAGGTRSIDADLVIVCAGAVHTPELLQRSGIGDPDVLRPAGVDVRHALHGTGRGLADHARVELPLVMTPHGDDEGQRFGDALRLHLRVATERASTDADVDLSIRHPRGRASVVLMAKLLEQRASGSVLLDPAGPSCPPRIVTGLATADDDVAALVDGIAIGVGVLLDAALLGRYRLERPLLGPSDVRAGRRSTGDMVGTCRMGADGDATRVVDADLAVDGLAGLLVADASVLPVLPHAGPTPAVVAVAEHAVDVVVGGTL